MAKGKGGFWSVVGSFVVGILCLAVLGMAGYGTYRILDDYLPISQVQVKDETPGQGEEDITIPGEEDSEEETQTPIDETETPEQGTEETETSGQDSTEETETSGQDVETSNDSDEIVQLA